MFLLAKSGTSSSQKKNNRVNPTVMAGGSSGPFTSTSNIHSKPIFQQPSTAQDHIRNSSSDDNNNYATANDRNNHKQSNEMLKQVELRLQSSLATTKQRDGFLHENKANMNEFIDSSKHPAHGTNLSTMTTANVSSSALFPPNVSSNIMSSSTSLHIEHNHGNEDGSALWYLKRFYFPSSSKVMNETNVDSLNASGGCGTIPGSDMVGYQLRHQFHLFYDQMESKSLLIFLACLLMGFIGVPSLLLTILDWDHYSMHQSNRNLTIFLWSLGTMLACGLVLTLIVVGHFYLQQPLELISHLEEDNRVDPLINFGNHGDKAMKKQLEQIAKQRQLLYHALQEKYERRKYYFKLLIIFLIELCVVIFAIRRSYDSVCSYDIKDESNSSASMTHIQSFLNYFYCGCGISSSHYVHAVHILDDVVLLLVIVPPLCLLLAPGTINLISMWLMSLSSLVTYVSILAVHSASPPILILLMWFVSNVLVPIYVHGRDIKVFLLHQQLQESSKQGAQEQEEQHLSEMRYVIANVAHDLKTPLSSFVAGIECIKSAVDDARHSLSGEQYQSIKQSLITVTDTNAFMLMTINRCIDYAKATKGIKLVPKLETIDLWETIQLPLQCIQNIQDRVTIDIDLLPRTLCSHLITDKQWLQENLLCLLSNAVKYMSKGSVSLKLSIIEQASKPSNNRGLASIKQPFQSDLSSRRNGFDPANSISISSVNTIDSLWSTRPTQFLLFEVEDNGIGVPPELMNSLFRPFKQTQRLAGGTGLGLYSLAKRIEAIHGEYGVKGRKDGGKGSLFWFTIPYRPDEITANLMAKDIHRDSMENSPPVTNQDSCITEAQVGNISPTMTTPSTDVINMRKSAPISVQLEDALARAAQVRGVSNNHQGNTTFAAHTLNLHVNVNVSTTTNCVAPDIAIAQTVPALEIPTHNQNRGLQILLVDDSLLILKMTAMILRKNGHTVTTAENGQIAVNHVEERWRRDHDIFDVILMDLQMPVMDGLEATKRIREIEDELPKHVIIGVSANSDNETYIAAFNCGINAFIAKPFTLDIFNKALRSVLQQSSIMDAHQGRDFVNTENIASKGSSTYRKSQFLLQQ